MMKEKEGIKRSHGRYPWREDNETIEYICEKTGINENIVRDVISVEVEYFIKKAEKESEEES